VILVGDPSTPRLEPNISKKAGFRDSVPKDYQYEMAYGDSLASCLNWRLWELTKMMPCMLRSFVLRLSLLHVPHAQSFCPHFVQYGQFNSRPHCIVYTQCTGSRDIRCRRHLV